MTRNLSVVFFLSLALLVGASAPAAPTQIATERSEEILQFASSLAHIASADSASFSPDDQQISYISDLNGSRQVWIVSARSGYPRLVTLGEDSVPFALWSPTNKDCIAYATCPAGTNDYALYTVHPDGTCVRRVSPTGSGIKTFLNIWTGDGRKMLISSNMREKVADEPYLLDPETGKIELLMKTNASIHF
jgi:Tol biopolymer transport system component